MKKILVRAGIVLIVLVIIAVVSVRFFLDGAVKRGIETVGPRLTQVTVRLDNVHLSIFSGSGRLEGFLLGNPEGFKTPHAIIVSNATLQLKPASLLSDKVVIQKIELIAPEITFEAGLGGNNLNTILANVEAATGGGAETNAAPPEAARKLQVDDFSITGAKLHLSVAGMQGRSLPVVLPPIHLTDLGTGPEGITAAELTRQLLVVIEREAVKMAASNLPELEKAAQEMTRDLQKSATERAGKLGEGLGDLLKKK